MRKVHLVLGFPVVWSVLACSGADETAPPGDTSRPDETAPVESTPESPFRAGVADPCAAGPDTGYLNDDLCLEAPPEDVGFQLHFGPDGLADYDDPVALAPFVLGPGEENTLCQYRRTPNAEPRFTTEQHIRVRSGTHHLLVWGAPSEAASAAAPPEGTLFEGENCGARDGYLFQSGLQSALGPEGGALDIPRADGQTAEENEGLGRRIPSHSSVVLEMHYVNTTDDPLLREAWANTVYASEEDIDAVISPLMFLGGLGMSVPPHSSAVVGAGPCSPPEGLDSVRILGVNGHGHAHMARFSAWVDRAGGNREPIYDAYDWSEPMVAQFDTATMNPTLGQPGTDGAHSGILTLGVGDSFSWECEVNNTLDQEIRWANEAYTSEMCNLFGYYTVGTLEDSGNWTCITP